MSYATNTSVPVEKTRVDIERMLLQQGAGQIMSAFDAVKGTALIGWSMGGRMVRLSIPLPDPQEKRFKHRRVRGGYSWRALPAEKQRSLWEQACRTRWRAILLILKAKFEAIEAGISTIEREFLADTVMADGRSVGEWITPQLDAMYASGRMPALLPAAGGGS